MPLEELDFSQMANSGDARHQMRRRRISSWSPCSPSEKNGSPFDVEDDPVEPRTPRDGENLDILNLITASRHQRTLRRTGSGKIYTPESVRQKRLLRKTRSCSTSSTPCTLGRGGPCNNSSTSSSVRRGPLPKFSLSDFLRDDDEEENVTNVTTVDQLFKDDEKSIRSDLLSEETETKEHASSSSPPFQDTAHKSVLSPNSPSPTGTEFSSASQTCDDEDGDDGEAQTFQHSSTIENEDTEQQEGENQWQMMIRTSSRHAMNLQNRDLYQMFWANKWVKICISILDEAKTLPPRELIRWVILIVLWFVAIVNPYMLVPRSLIGGAGTVGPTTAGSGNNVSRTHVASTKIRYPEPHMMNLAELAKVPPSLSITVPENRNNGDIRVMVQISNIYPEYMPLHRNPQICLRLAGEGPSQTMLGCVKVVEDTLTVLLRDLQPGPLTIYGSLISQVKTLAKSSQSFYVNREATQIIKAPIMSMQSNSAGSNKRGSNNNEQQTCVTQCTRTCTFFLEDKQ